MNVVIVIVSYNGMQWIERCLSSSLPYPVIVVDNNSSDGTQGFIKEHFPTVTLIENKNNLGFGIANNVGIQIALENNFEFVFLLNQDAYLEHDTIKNLIIQSRLHPDYGILSPIHFQDGWEILDKNFSYFIRYEMNRNFIGDAVNKVLKDLYSVPFINAAGWLLTKEAIEVVGGFDPLFFMYGEDDNLCQRMKYHGYKIGVVTTAKMIHDRSERTEPWIEPFSEAYFKKMRKHYLNVYANINNLDYKSHFEATYSSIRKLARKNKFKLSFKRAKNHELELKLLNDLLPQIELSRARNSEKNQSLIQD
jgi:GT2 family glycosyltransferase